MQNATIYFISHFLSPEFIDTALVTFADIAFVTFVIFIDTLSATFKFSSNNY